MRNSCSIAMVIGISSRRLFGQLATATASKASRTRTERAMSDAAAGNPLKTETIALTQRH